MELLQKYFPEDKYVVNNLKNTPIYKSKRSRRSKKKSKNKKNKVAKENKY